MEPQYTASITQDRQLVCVAGSWLQAHEKPVASLDLGAEALPRSELSSDSTALVIRKLIGVVLDLGY
jgi:hypothetical protein